MTTDTSLFPHPTLVGDDAPFWLAAREGRLDIQACAECGTLRHPPRPVCAHCGATGIVWKTVSGRGELWSLTTVHPPTLPAFADRVPYVAIVVRLEEGPFVVSTLAASDEHAAAAANVGAAVEVAFEKIDDDLTLPLFRLADPPTR